MRGYLPDRNAVGKHRLAVRRVAMQIQQPMWNEPYLETCCRAALHRLTLCGPPGRPPAMKDGPCLTRLAGMGLACSRIDGRFEITVPGRQRHATEILKRT